MRILEQEREIWRLEQSKEMDLWKLYTLRVLVGIVGIFLVVSLFLVRLYFGESSFPAGGMWLGSVAETIFLGSIGFFVSACTNQAVLGYMVAVFYYLCNDSAGKYFGKFALFQMMKQTYDFWPLMLAASILALAAGMALRERRR